MADPRIESIRSFMIYDSRTKLHDLDPSKGEVPTFLGYFNVTVEDDTEWESDKYIRMCLHMYKNQNNREMIRFLNQNSIADEDGNVNSADFKIQFSKSDQQENPGDMRYWCTRRHDWEGVLTTANHNKKMAASDAAIDEAEPEADPDAEPAMPHII